MKTQKIIAENDPITLQREIYLALKMGWLVQQVIAHDKTWMAILNKDIE
jgi:hypothetical protein